jgi:putative transposase
LNTFYKYAQLLGYASNRHIYKYPNYSPLITSKPNQFWCADVTILRLVDHSKIYIHLLIDHFSRKILDFKVDSSSKAKNITQMVRDAYQKLHDKPTDLVILTDDGTENKQLCYILETKHFIAQKDVCFSNSAIESVNKVLKHQFLLPLKLQNSYNFLTKLTQIIDCYNNLRPQLSLAGNTPNETYQGKTIDLSQYKEKFSLARAERIAQNQYTDCKLCI